MDDICRKIAVRIAVVLMLAILLGVGCAGAVPVDEWNKTFGGTKPDEAHSVQKTKDGGYILAGTTRSYGAGEADVWLIKTNSKGNELWNNTFGGKSDDGASQVRQTSDGGYIISGYTFSYGAGGRDAWLIKTDANGSELWNATYGGKGSDEANSVQQTLDGGYVIAGSTNSSGAGYYNAYIIKTDAKGNRKWNRTFVGNSANSVEQTSDGGYILAGSIGSIGTAIWLEKTDAGGNEQWNMTFGGHADWANSVQQTSDGSYILAGNMYSPGLAWACLIKTNANGKELWSERFGEKAEVFQDEGYSVQQTSDEGFILAGITTLYARSATTGQVVWTPYSYALLIKTDADGKPQWNKTYGGGVHGDAAYSVQQTKDGGYILAGSTKSYGSGDSDAWLIKVGEAPTETAEAPAASPTQTLTAVPTGIPKVSLTEKAAGFEVFLAISILLLVLISRRKRSK